MVNKMKIGIFSDIHSNIIAFKECIKYLEAAGCDEYFFLGDYVSDTPYTKETMECLYDFIHTHTCHLLRGNREDYMLGQRKVLRDKNEKEKWIYNSASGNLLYAYEQLTEKDLDFFEQLPITFKYEKEGYPSITCCHGSPTNSRELLELYGENTKEWLAKVDTDYLICAHTHFPGELCVNGKHYFNTGCIGISINDFGFAQCMTIESQMIDGKMQWVPNFLKIPYDNLQVVAEIKKRGLLDKAPWFINCNIQILLTGEDNAAKMVAKANQLVKEANDTCVWPLIDEKYFEEAARLLKIPDYRK